jgi:hypothetical protein
MPQKPIPRVFHDFLAFANGQRRKPPVGLQRDVGGVPIIRLHPNTQPGHHDLAPLLQVAQHNGTNADIVVNTYGFRCIMCVTPDGTGRVVTVPMVQKNHHQLESTDLCIAFIAAMRMYQLSHDISVIDKLGRCVCGMLFFNKMRRASQYCSNKCRWFAGNEKKRQGR